MIFLLTETHPNYSKKWIKYLLDYASENGKTPNWVLSGKWKQRTTKYEKYSVCNYQSICSRGNEFLITLKENTFSEEFR
jgi:hypothetical protein